MTISITGPDGSKFSFPDGMSEADISSAMESHYGGEKPGVLEDAAKGGVVGLAQGVIGLPGAGGDLQKLAGGIAAKPLGWLAEKFDQNFPTMSKFLKEESAKSAKLPAAASAGADIPGTPLPSSADIQAPIEKVTGPFYEAKTPVGKAVQTAAQVAPAIALGGESLLGTAAKAAGAGAVSEGAGEAANAAKGVLPEVAQPYAEPVARAVGAGLGLFTPGGARRAVTPLPMSDERLATVNALRRTNPELVNASSAGQLTESPRVAGLEARSPRMANLPQQQNEAYTQGVMRQAGAPGAMFDTAGLAQAKGTGAQLDALRNAHEINPAEYALLNKDINRMGRPGSDLYKAVGTSEPFNNIKQEIALGPSGGNPMPLSMTGQRYGALKQMIQSAADSAPTSHEQIALANARTRMTQALHNSMPADEAERLRNLDQQYSNYKTIEGIPAKVGENTITPNQVFSKAERGTPLETHAEQAASVMTPLPKPNTEGGFGTKVIGGLLPLLGDAAIHGGTALGAESPFMSYYGFNHMNDAVQALKNTAGRTVAHPVSQAYLKNQAWRPGPNSTVDAATLARLLLSPPVNQGAAPGQ